MTDSLFQALMNLSLSITFLWVAVENLNLYLLLNRRTDPTDLGIAMLKKYAAWFCAGVVLSVLQFYSFYFNLTQSSGIFTYPVRNTLRVVAVIGMVVVIVNMRRMYRELKDAESDLTAEYKD